MTTEPDPFIDSVLNPADETADPSSTFVPNPDDYTLPTGVDWTPMCPDAAVGAPPNLDDVQAQLLENQSAKAEGRPARTLAIRCSFCQQYHLEMQPSPATLTGGEVAGDPNEDSVPPVAPPPVDETLVTEAIAALDPSSVESGYEPGAEGSNDGNSGVVETNTDSGSSNT